MYRAIHDFHFFFLLTKVFSGEKSPDPSKYPKKGTHLSKTVHTTGNTFQMKQL
jgi:hypothetical protein